MRAKPSVPARFAEYPCDVVPSLVAGCPLHPAVDVTHSGQAPWLLPRCTVVGMWSALDGGRCMAPRSNRPAVTVHYAQTLDGRIATSGGSSQWISGDQSLRFAHQLRAEHQAVLIGVGTLIADNPRLTVRLALGESPLRVVADSTLRLPLDCNVLTDGAARTLIATTARASREQRGRVRGLGADVLVVRQDERGRVDLHDLLHRLASKGISSTLIEGGGDIITSALRSRLVDHLIVCIAPKVVGTGIPAVKDLDILRMADALTFCESSFAPLGDDMIFRGSLRWSDGVSTEGAKVSVAGRGGES
jgi:riboflavin-specific deaminase-like protein